MKLSRASTYAIGAVLQLSDTPDNVPIPCSQLARLGEMPERFLLQVLRSLVNQGILHSSRGVDGGYYLERPLHDITLLQIVEATDGPQVPIIPPLDALPEGAREELQRILRDITEKSCKQMAQVNLEQLRGATRLQESAEKPTHQPQ